MKKAHSKSSKKQKKNTPRSVRVFVAGGSRSGKIKMYTQQAYELGKAIGQQNYQLTFGLSSRGIMGAVAKGVLEEWCKKAKPAHKPIEGVTTTDYLKRYDTEKELADISDIVVAKTLEERKKHMLEAEFVIFAPGGVGTLDELAFDCVAMQDGLLPKKPFIIFNINGFFHHLLEFIKSIHLKGFCDFVPFIVVDNAFEATVAFEMIAYRYSAHRPTEHQTELVLEQIVHDLPYVIEQRRTNPNWTTEQILNTLRDVFSSDDARQKKAYASEIETAYFNKEIARMYDRLEKAGRDTAAVSHKLSSLKRRYQKRI